MLEIHLYRNISKIIMNEIRRETCAARSFPDGNFSLPFGKKTCAELRKTDSFFAVRLFDEFEFFEVVDRAF